MAATSPILRKHDEDEENQIQNDVVTVDLLTDVKNLTLGRTKPRHLLIFDLNGLLIHRAHKYFLKPGDSPANRPPDVVVGKHFVYRRPFSKKFLEFCLERFEVAIWSSAMEHNMEGVMDLVFGSEFSSKLLFIWSQSECSDYGFKSPERKEKPLYFKELCKVWENKWSKGSFSATNTLLVDDKPYKGLLNPPNTGIFPNSYDPKDANDNALDSEGELGLYLKGLAEAEDDDVPSYVASHPFGQPAIKEDHPEWSLYSKILTQINKRTSRQPILSNLTVRTSNFASKLDSIP